MGNVEVVYEDGANCIDYTDVFVMQEPYERTHYWKSVMLCAIGFQFVYTATGFIHERFVLQDEEKLAKDYEALSDRVKRSYHREKLEETRTIKLSGNKIDLTFALMKPLFEFLAIYFNLPALIWYGWLKVLYDGGRCDNGDTFGQMGQNQLGLLFFLSYYGLEAVYLCLPRWWDLVHKRSNGLNDSTCCQFLISQLVRFLMVNILREIPALYLAAMLLTGVSKFWFAASVSLTTVFAMAFVVYGMPHLSCFALRYLEFPPEQSALQSQIKEVFRKKGIEDIPVKLIQTRDGNLHSNARMSAGKIYLGTKLLEHHKDFPEEVVAIACHEYGHYYHNHVSKMCLLNVFYMFGISWLMLPFVDNQIFLSAFHIDMKSQLLTIWLIYMLFKNSIVIILGLFIKAYERWRETQADLFCVKMGYGKEAYNAMVRNFEMNKEFIFSSEVSTFLNRSHPSFLTRINDLEKEQIKHERRGEDNVQVKVGVEEELLSQYQREEIN